MAFSNCAEGPSSNLDQGQENSPMLEKNSKPKESQSDDSHLREWMQFSGSLIDR